MAAECKAQFDLVLADPGDDPLEDQVMDVLRSALIGKGDKTTPLSIAAEKIAILMPQSQLYSQEVGRFLMACYEAAEQIPYGSRQTHDLVSIIEKVMVSPRLSTQAGSERVGTNPDYRYQTLAETLRDWINTLEFEGAQRYVNFQSFQAALFSAGLLRDGVQRMIWTMDEAFGVPPTPTDSLNPLGLHNEEIVATEPKPKDAHVLSAAEWIHEYGVQCYDQISQKPCVYGAREISLLDWKHWKKGFESYGIDENDGEVSAFQKECKLRAVRAAREMEKIADRIA